MKALYETLLIFIKILVFIIVFFGIIRLTTGTAGVAGPVSAVNYPVADD